MTYYLTKTVNRKNAKRHIVTKSTDLFHLQEMAESFDKSKATYEIFRGNWVLLYEYKEV